jgi:hypothetical protein
MRLPPFRFVVLDTETTGFIPRVNRVIEFASIRCEGGKIVDTYEQLLHIDSEIPDIVKALTRITPEMLQDQPPMDTARPTIIEHLGNEQTLVVGQNLQFDIGMLKGEGIDLSTRANIDTSLLASLAFPEFRSYSLPYMSAKLQLDHAPAHRALGDVKATLGMLGAIWERLCELPEEERAIAVEIFGKSSPGYAALFAALPPATKKKAEWLQCRCFEKPPRPLKPTDLVVPSIGKPTLQEESLDPCFINDCIAGAAADTSHETWFAVKNLDAFLRRGCLPEGVQPIYPPQLLLDPAGATRLMAQDTFTPEEASLAVKLRWTNPETRADVALHGSEREIWNGKLAATAESEVYLKQFTADSQAFIVDHRQLLQFLADPAHAAHGRLTTDDHIVIDDASMLEDTATKAYGHFVAVDDLRASAEGNVELTRFTDALSLWIETIRGNEDVHRVTAADLRRTETDGMRTRLATIAAGTDLTPKAREIIMEAAALLEGKTLDQQMIWCERRQNGSLFLQSAPEHVDRLLADTLFTKFPTTLLVPIGCDGHLAEVIAPDIATTAVAASRLNEAPLSIAFSPATTRTLLQDPPAGRTIILAGSKRVIEILFNEYTEALEKRSVTLICQGTSGGQGRMESEFAASGKDAIWLLTPWMYEGIDLPGDVTVDRLVLDTLPFDHPGQMVFAKRKDHFKNSFSGYSMPRLQHRLFRILRTFKRHQSPSAEFLALDPRLREKDYGKDLQKYLLRFGSQAPVTDASAVTTVTSTPEPTPAKKAVRKKKGGDAQLELPL